MRLAIVGEAWGADEEREKRAFVGAAGRVLDRLLRQAGIDRDACLVTNVVNARPPGNAIDEWIVFKKKPVPDYTLYQGAWCHPLVVLGIETLRNALAEFRPDKILALGNTPLWALTELRGIGNWRGSELEWRGTPLIPTYHPAALLRQADLQFEVKHDFAHRLLKASHTRPAWRFGIGLALPEIMARLASFPPGEVAADIETSRHSIISIALASSPVDALAIPFFDGEGRPLWALGEETALREAIHAVLRSSPVIGQNWHYDRWYINECWGLDVPAAWDTMVAQHVLMAGKPKDLGYLSSLYCGHHVYWKDDLKDWKETRVDAQLAHYNCEDAARTWEIASVQREHLRKRGLVAQFAERIRFADSCHRMSRRGIPVHIENRLAITADVEAGIDALQERVNVLAGCELNVRSPAVGKLLYGTLGMPKAFHRKTGASTANDEALAALAKRHPEHVELLEGIIQLRTLKSLRSGFLAMLPDLDGRARTSFNAAGPETYRLSSSENPWGGGTNFQNITSGG